MSRPATPANVLVGPRARSERGHGPRAATLLIDVPPSTPPTAQHTAAQLSQGGRERPNLIEAAQGGEGELESYGMLGSSARRPPALPHGYSRGSGPRAGGGVQRG